MLPLSYLCSLSLFNLHACIRQDTNPIIILYKNTSGKLLRLQFHQQSNTHDEITTYHTKVCLCMCLCVQTGCDRKPFDPRQKKSFFSASVDLDVITDSPLIPLAMTPAATKVSCFKRTAGIEECTHIRWPDERKRVTFWSRCCPRVLSRRRRFYSKRLFLGALASEPAGLQTTFSS